ncbi:hypothetical protein e2017b09.tmp0231 [Eimeria tenella]|uniref:Uncharacterized protein n=1 Tax=Eimeria tenella TaxID=5802 RepID=C8TDX2_EIMTE|nr:hypothetical protein e2017b09.tmp0231 [Eimeria tenella]
MLKHALEALDTKLTKQGTKGKRAQQVGPVKLGLGMDHTRLIYRASSINVLSIGTKTLQGGQAFKPCTVPTDSLSLQLLGRRILSNLQAGSSHQPQSSVSCTSTRTILEEQKTKTDRRKVEKAIKRRWAPDSQLKGLSHRIIA